MSYIEKEKLIKADIVSIENRVRHAFNQGYDLGYKRGLEKKPKVGHWIEEFVDTEGEVRFTCSCCGKYQLFGTDFCYNCGAKMVEPQESEETE